MLELILSSALIISSRSPCTCTRSMLPPCPTTGCEVEERHLEIAQPTKNNFFTVAKTKFNKKSSGIAQFKKMITNYHSSLDLQSVTKFGYFPKGIYWHSEYLPTYFIRRTIII